MNERRVIEIRDISKNSPGFGPQASKISQELNDPSKVLSNPIINVAQKFYNEREKLKAEVERGKTSSTQIGNEIAFEDHQTLIIDMLDRGILSKEDVSITFIDANFLKSFNEVFGYDTGDTALFITAQILNHSSRTNEKTFHVHGDEYIKTLLKSGEEGANKYEARVVNTLKAYNNWIPGSPPSPNLSQDEFKKLEHLYSFFESLNIPEDFKAFKKEGLSLPLMFSFGHASCGDSNIENLSSEERFIATKKNAEENMKGDKEQHRDESYLIMQTAVKKIIESNSKLITPEIKHKAKKHLPNIGTR